MQIEQKSIPIRDLVKGYVNNDDEGVLGYGGRLNIRPKYQREFVYKDEQRNAVIKTVVQGFPLNTMYWSENADGSLEVLDGQQRIISVCEYHSGAFSLPTDHRENPRYFHSLTDAEKDQILDYQLMVYFCRGSDKDKLDWFQIINIAGVELTKQELRNAVYSGLWVTDAKRYFSRRGAPAQHEASEYLKGKAIRQEYLETAIDWVSPGKVEEYMSAHQHETSANPLWLHFMAVIEWVKATFPEYRKEMKGLAWGELYDAHCQERLDPAALEGRISALLADDEVQKRSGIWPYVLTGDERHLNLRAFSDNQKRVAYERQKGVCNNSECSKECDISEMEADHITPWSKGGKTVQDNCQMLCQECNRRKSNK